jgi:glycosyltransferase involved in cell wall biosynthesis
MGRGSGRFHAAADVFLLPTLGEGHSLALTEAAAHGLPLVTTTASGQERLLAHGREALLAAPGDAGGLAGHVLTLLDRPALAARLGAAARRWAERFDVHAMTRAYVGLAELLAIRL